MWLRPLRLVAGTACESIGLSLMFSRFPKPCRSANHSSTLLQVLVDHTPFICHIRDCSIFRLAVVQPKSTYSTTHDQLLWQTDSQCQCKFWPDFQPNHSWSQAPTWLSHQIHRPLLIAQIEPAFLLQHCRQECLRLRVSLVIYCYWTQSRHHCKTYSFMQNVSKHFSTHPSYSLTVELEASFLTFFLASLF